MYFTRARHIESFGAVPMRSLDETENVLDAIYRVTNRNAQATAKTVIATLRADRTWTGRIPSSPLNHVYIQPCPGRPYIVTFEHNRRYLELALATALGAQVGTASIEIACDLAVSGSGTYSLDTDWLFSLYQYYSFQNDAVFDGDSLAAQLGRSRPNGEMLSFNSQAYGVQLFVDGTYLGPFVDQYSTPLRHNGFGTLQGPAYADLCRLSLTLIATSGYAFDDQQQRLRWLAHELSALVAPQG